MQMKTSELTGAALDWVVTKLRGAHESYLHPQQFMAHHDEGKFHYSSEWAKGGPIIEREEINLEVDDGQWTATSIKKPYVSVAHHHKPLVAAMRCYVASKLGDTVEIPEELKGERHAYG